jgi:lysozyme family protein
MAATSFAPALRLILKHEGGYVDHPLDPGGATNRGITRATLAAHRGKPVSKAEVMALGEREAGEIYRARYWNAIRADDLPSGVDLVVFDAAVNSGPSRAARWLQTLLGVPADGLIGERTLAAARARPAETLIRDYSRQRLAFLRRLGTFRAFGQGWTRRVRETETAALALAGAGGASSPRRPTRSTMTDTKSLFTSKTMWANLIGLGALTLSIFGLDTSGVDQAGLANALAQTVAAGSFIASTVFRVTAKKRIALM